MDSQIELKRETEFYQGFIRLKMSVSNKAPSVITDVTLDFIYEDDLLQINHYEPSYKLRKGKIFLGNISGDTSKSISVYFDPLICTRGAEINCQVTFRDSKGQISSVFIEPKIVSVVCPILKTDLDINVGRLKEFIEKLPIKDSKVYEIQQGFDVSKLSSIAREVVEKHDVRHIRTLKTKDSMDWEIWYYGKTKVTKADIVIKVSISSEKQLLELFAATETAEALTGLLAEVGRGLKYNIESRASGIGNVINLTIKDSVIQRSSLLDHCDMSGRCSTNIIVEDSVIQHSSIASLSGDVEPDEGNDSSTNEVEGNESLQKKREELERLKAEMEELRKRREEGEKRNKEKEDLERKQREEQEIKYREEAERISKEELERRKLEEARKISAAKKETKSHVQKEYAPKKPGSSSGKGILVFSLIFGVLLIGIVAMFLGSNGDSGDSPQEIQPVQNSDTYTNSIGMEFVKIPAGEFMMGSPSDEEGRRGNEGPVHKVTIEESYYLGKYEVTQEQWREVMGSNPSYFKGDDLPVEQVSWNDAQEFIEKLNEMEGTNKYRLPSEAEWEYACRAGTTTRYYFGDGEWKLGGYAWYSGNSGSKTHPVGKKKPNSWGLYDMHGNVWEWVQDSYHSNYEGAPSDGSDRESGSSSFRVYRGGGWSGDAGYCGSADRYDDLSGYRFINLGFRVLMEV